MEDQFIDKAKTWDTIPWKNRLAEEAYQLVKDRININPSWKMFDIGGGTGLFSLKFLDDLAEITVVDTSEAMLKVLREKIAEQNLTSVKIKECELQEDTFPEKSFDFCISMMTLHHIENLEELFCNVYKILTPGGRVAFIDLAAEEGDFHPEGVEYVYNGFEESQLITPLEKAGFKECQSSSSLSVTKPSKLGEIKTYPILLITAKKPI